MQHYLRHTYLVTLCFLSSFFISIPNEVAAQSAHQTDSTLLYIHQRDSILSSQYDISDLIGSIIHPKRKRERSSARSPITLMPNVAYNPTIGGQIGIKQWQERY